MQRIAERIGLDPATTWLVAGIVACLLVATVVRGLARWRRPSARSRSRWRSLMTWWTLFVLVVSALLVGRRAVTLLFAVVAVLALRESLGLARRLSGALPKAAAFLLAVSGPAFAVAVAWLPPPAAHPDAALGWLVLLLVLTELNDMAQAWWGRALGVHHMAPTLSPNKTWEGLVGGIATTVAAAWLLAPRITDHGHPIAGVAPSRAWLQPLVVGLLIAAAGVAGDLWASALKRRAGTKDSGRLLPGQGGVLDRIDSLAASAPVYLAAARLLAGS